MRLLELVGQHFVLAAQLGDIGLDLLDVAEQIGQPGVFRFERVEPLRQRSLDLVDARLELVDAPARLVVVEQRAARRRRELRGEQQDGERRERRPQRGTPRARPALNDAVAAD